MRRSFIILLIFVRAWHARRAHSLTRTEWSHTALTFSTTTCARIMSLSQPSAPTHAPRPATGAYSSSHSHRRARSMEHALAPPPPLSHARLVVLSPDATRSRTHTHTRTRAYTGRANSKYIPEHQSPPLPPRVQSLLAFRPWRDEHALTTHSCAHHTTRTRTSQRALTTPRRCTCP